MNVSKIVLSQNLPQLVNDLQRQLNQIVDQLNGISSGRVSAVTSAYTAAPTGGTWAAGDFVTNSAPVEQGSAGSKFVITGWVCTAGGSPGTWLAARCLTGN
ncbi:hypothetical protein [Caballeronia sp. AZ1_KS37]|uniref:hypothetical protein n=1 Tax=Caballeronia sp. AZ1_KS37 TaxID=2921756 RepID=UPI002028ABBF|nr:hypothetical protein [Caballeronia sp. AZ1_KS37]